MAVTMNGSTTTVTTLKPSSDAIILRRGHFKDAKQIGQVAAKTYRDTPLTIFLSPNRLQYYSHYERGFIQRATARMFDPRNITVIACEASNPSRVIGYAQFARLGDDEGAMRQIESRKSLWLWALSWLFWAWAKLVVAVNFGDKSCDLKNLRTFEGWCAAEGPVYWDREDRKNRWHAQSVVVLEEFQGRGIGKRLMKEAIAWAEAENVPLGLEASEPGEKMYRSVGFELLARFQHVVDGDNGGYMMYTPKALRTKESS
jgi:GNAT superfamily N-acetyltransferase